MSDEKSLLRLHAIVEGRVQGVGFRMFVVDHAQRLDVVGWVRNRWDDTVEVTAEGERQALEALVKVLRTGPYMSEVSKLNVEWQKAQGEFKRFWITQTF